MQTGLPPALLHATVFDPAISRVALLDSLVSYRALAAEERYAWQLINVMVSGAIGAYDLPDLVGAVAPRLVLVAVAGFFRFFSG